MSCIAGARQFGNEDQGWVAHFLYSALTGTPVTIYGTGLQVRDVLCVDDLMRAFEAVREKSEITRGQIYNVGGGRKNTVSLVELAALIRRLTGAKMKFEHEPMRPGDQLIYVTDHGKLTRDTGWNPEINLEGALQRMQAWFRKNRDLFAPARALDFPAIPLDAAELGRTA
jgi:CDP-paratose 2-epimerase